MVNRKSFMRLSTIAVKPRFRVSQRGSQDAYFSHLLLFTSNLALIGTTDPELDEIHSELDRKLKQIGIPDDKIYTNNKYFFCNMTFLFSALSQKLLLFDPKRA